MSLLPESHEDVMNVLEMQDRIKKLEGLLSIKHEEFEQLRSDCRTTFENLQKQYEDRFTELESRSESMGPTSSRKSKINKPEEFEGKPGQSLQSFVGHMELFLRNEKEAEKTDIAASYLRGAAYEWYLVAKEHNLIVNWESMKQNLYATFEPVNKVELARDKLAVIRQTSTIERYNEEFRKIIFNIPRLSQDEAMDRYKRGLKINISTLLCTNKYENLNEMMSDASKYEVSTSSFSRSLGNQARPSGLFQPKNYQSRQSGVTPMDISNARLQWSDQKLKDYNNGACFYCHKKGCRVETCPLKKSVNNLNLEKQGNEPSQ